MIWAGAYLLGGGGGGGGRDAPTSIFKPEKVQLFQFQASGYCFLGVFRNYTDYKFHGFYRVYYKVFHFLLVSLRRSATRDETRTNHVY